MLYVSIQKMYLKCIRIKKNVNLVIKELNNFSINIIIINALLTHVILQYNELLTYWLFNIK